jgi:hypothetical protein
VSDIDTGLPTRHTLPWHTLRDKIFGRRCRAVLEPPYPHTRWGDFGRCELRQHSPNIDHALERGMYDVRWSTQTSFTDPGASS